jgi:TM2 domain-containing membrane protein YozV
MALLNCPDCGRQISTEAAVCIGCGRPLKATAQPAASADMPAQAHGTAVVTQPLKSRGTFIILGLFLGCLGIHNFYAGYHGKGAAQIIISLLLGWLVVGFVITGIWALIEVCTVRVDARGNPMS